MAALAFVALFSVLGLGAVAYWTEQDALRVQLSEELESSATYKQAQLITWLNERRADVQYLAQNPLNQQYFADLLDPTIAPQRKNHFATSLTASLLTLQQARTGYRQVLIADQRGIVTVATDGALIGTSIAGTNAFTATLSATDGYIQDIRYDPRSGLYEMCFGYRILPTSPSASTRSASTTQAPLGVIIVTVDMQQTIFPMLLEWQLGNTGVTVLSRAENGGTRILNQLRFEDNVAPLERFLPPPATPDDAKPAHWAARGQEGTSLTIDHLGVPVLTVYRHIPGIHWGLVLKMDRSEIFAPLRHLLWHVVFIAVGVICLALLVSVLIARTLTRSLEQLVRATRAVAVGTTPVFPSLQREDELGDLTRAFRDMTETLDDQKRQNAQLMERLQHWNSELEQKVEERTFALATANEQLKELDKMKSELLCTLSHELRNPLTNLRLQLDLLRKHLDSPRRERYLGALSRQVDILTQLITDMLELIQIDRLQGEIRFTTLDFNRLVAEVVEKYQPQFQQRNVLLRFEPIAKPLFMRGERSQLHLAVTHLLKNALNFSAPGEVTICTGNINQQIYVQVKDNGIGIASSDLPYIFERFYRGANVSQTSIAGSGLGLSLVKEIAELHQGQIEVQSHLQQGATFRLWLPMLAVEVMQTVLRA